MKLKNDHRSKFPSETVGKKKPKKIGLQRDSNPDLRDTGAMLYQLNFETTHWERGQLIDFISSREE